MNKSNKHITILLWKNKYEIFLTQIAFIIMAISVGIPVIVKGFFGVLKFSKYNAITKENYLHIIKSPGTVIYILILLILVALLMLLNITMITVLLDRRKRKERDTFLGFIGQVVSSIIRYMTTARIATLWYFIVYAIAFYMPVGVLAIYNNSISSYLAENIVDVMGVKMYWSLYAIIYILCVLFAVWKFPVVRALIISDKGYKRIRRTFKPKFLEIMKKFKYYGPLLLGENILLIAFYLLLMFICILVVRIIEGGENSLFAFYQIYGLVHLAIGFVFAVIAGAVNVSALVELNKGYSFEYNEAKEKLENTSKKVVAITFALVTFAGMVLCVGLALHSNGISYSSLGHMKISAHRGCSSEAPENTIASIKKAIEADADYVEIDVRVTKDGEVILMHDANAERTTGTKLKIADSTMDEINMLDAGWKFSSEYIGEKVPTLREVLELCDGEIRMNIELKPTNNSGELEKKVVDLIEEFDMEDKVMITSFSQTAIVRVKALNKKITTGYIYTFGYSNNINYKGMDVLSISSRYLTRDVVAGAHSKGIIVAAWTINSKAEMKRMKAIGVDNIITDKVGLAKKVIYNNNNSGMKDAFDFVLEHYKFRK